VRALAAFNRRSPALMVQTPSATYHISPNGYGDGLNNVYVVSRHQLNELMLAEGLRREHLTDPDTAERLAETVADFHQQRTQRA
jgi:aminoglycoside phosphotransferase family enzyme